MLPYAFRISHTGNLTGLSRSTIYRLVQAGELKLVKLSARASGITRASLIEYFDSHGIPVPPEFKGA